MTHEELRRQWRAAPLYDKVRDTIDINQRLEMHEWISYRGFVSAKDEFAHKTREGEYYVYIWKHMFGKPFYVGSGHGYRWIDIHCRNRLFYAELDKGDAVVYKVIDGLKEADARYFETYVSLSLDLAGVELSNLDNRVRASQVRNVEAYKERLSEMRNHAHALEVENVITDKILMDNAFNARDILEVRRFEKVCGERYFTEKYAVGEDK